MHDIATIAALEWARTNSRHGEDPSTFGANVAKAYFACRDAKPVSAAELEAAQQIDAMYQAMQSARIEVKPPDAAIDLVRCAGLSDPAPTAKPVDSCNKAVKFVRDSLLASRHDTQALVWAQRFSSVDGVEDLMRGTRLCAEFLSETAASPHVSQALQVAALEAAAVLALRSGAEQMSHFPWGHVLEQARAILDGLTAPVSGPRPEPGGL